MNFTESLRKALSRWQWSAVLIAVIAGLLSGLAAVMDLQQFARSYLLGYLFWWSVSVGSLGLLMLFHLVGGRWGVAARPFLESGSLTIPLIALLALPLAANLELLYLWMHSDHDLGEKAIYLNVPFFSGRAVVYFVVWSLLALLLRQPRAPLRSEPPRWRRLVSAGGLVILILTVTFAAIDWAMSLDPHWFSSIYGAIFVVGSALSAMALTTLTCAALTRALRPQGNLLPADTMADLATLTLAFLMLWAYFSFSQYLIIWSGNLPEENFWYLDRSLGGWQWIVWALVVLHFFLPFFLLLSRDIKRSPGALLAVTLLILVMHAVDLLWTVVPTFHPRQFALHWADVAVPLAIGGIWAAVYLRLLQRRVPQIAEMSQP